MHCNKTFRAFLAISLTLLFGFSAFAANVTGRIRGTVTDPSGAVVVNTTVTATNVQTGVAYTAKSNNSGAYEFLQLPVGTYNVSATAPGFQKFAANGITLNIDQEYVQPIQFQVGQEAQTVEVQANAVQVDTTNMQLSNIVESKQIVDLPLIGRNWTQLEQLEPGVQATNDRFGTFSANGSQTTQSSYLINGTDSNDLVLNTPLYVPSPDALSEFNLITSSLNPEYDRNSGAIVSASVKSGTNAYHGDVFEFYRDTFLNTRNFFQQTKPLFHQNLFGGTIGGPVLKDKAFFFLSYQGNRAVVPQTNPVGTNTVFSAAQLGTGSPTANWTTLANGTNLSLSTNPIPGTLLASTGCPAGSTWQSCFQPSGSGTVLIPTKAYNPVALGLVSKFVPAVNGPNNEFIFNPTTNRVQDQGIARLDGNVTAKDQLWGVLVFQHAPSSDVLPFTGASLPGFGDVSTSETRQFTADWTHVFSGSTLNEFRLGYSRLNFGSTEPQTVVLPSTAGFAITPQFPAVAGLPTININGYFNLGFSNNGPQPRIDQTYQVTDSFSKIVGRHSLKFGFEGRRFNVDNPFFGNNNGTYSYSGQGTFSSGDPGLDFLLGVPDGYTQGAGGVINARAYESYIYGQDVWKIRDNLTLTYGAGWQVDTPLHNRQFQGFGINCFIPGEQSKVFPTAPTGLTYPGDPGCNDAGGATTAWKDVGPRFGFAYSPDLGWLSGAPGKLSIRGGYGIYFNRSEEETSLQNLGAPPFGVTSFGAVDFGASSPAFANPYMDIDTGATFTNKFPATFPKPGQAADFTTLEPLSISLYSSHFRVPYSENFNLTAQRELPSNIVATISYVGALGRHEEITFEGNPITAAGQAACLASPTCIADRNTQQIQFPTHTAFAPGNLIASVGTIDTSGSSNYNALQLSATKGFTHGLLFQASYTYSHALDNASGFENAGFGIQRGYNQFDPALNYGDSAFDTRHRFVFSPVYQIPSLKSLSGLHWLPDAIGKGWEISGIETLATGFPFDIAYDGSTSRSLFCAASVNFYACPDVPLQTGPLVTENPRQGKNFWFSPSNFTAEPLGQFGNTHRNAYHGPGINNTDVGVYKNIYLWGGNESRYIQLRLESYNVFNHTQFNEPTANFASASFGRIRSAAAGRQTQLAAKIYF